MATTPRDLPMNGGKAVHDIQVTHSYGETRSTEGDDGVTTVTNRCQQCGETSVRHVLTSVRGQSFAEASTEEVLEAFRSVSEKMRTGIDSMNAMWESLLVGTQYSSTEGLVDDLTKRYQDIGDGRRMPFRLLKTWVGTNNRWQQLKFLLALKQGLVCNRCDAMFSFEQLTVDHIVPDRSNSKLTNLQLLCESCNPDKGSESPGPKDVSPFSYVGEPCLHSVKCVEQV